MTLQAVKYLIELKETKIKERLELKAKKDPTLKFRINQLAKEIRELNNSITSALQTYFKKEAKTKEVWDSLYTNLPPKDSN